MAYVVWSIDKDENEYRQSIWLAKTDGSEPPRRFTTGKNDAQPRWSPDGDRLAFVSKRGDEKARNQLYVMPAGGGEPQCLTDLKEDVGEPAWSPDGTQIAFSARVQDDAYEEEDDKKRTPRRFKRLQFKLDSVGWTGDRRRHILRRSGRRLRQRRSSSPTATSRTRSRPGPRTATSRSPPRATTTGTSS